MIGKSWNFNECLVAHLVEADCAVRPQLVYLKPLSKGVKVSDCPVIRLIAVVVRKSEHRVIV